MSSFQFERDTSPILGWTMMLREREDSSVIRRTWNCKSQEIFILFFKSSMISGDIDRKVWRGEKIIRCTNLLKLLHKESWIFPKSNLHSAEIVCIWNYSVLRMFFRKKKMIGSVQEDLVEILWKLIRAKHFELRSIHNSMIEPNGYMQLAVFEIF